MSSSPEGQDMMDVLASNSNQLADDVAAVGSNAAKRQKLVLDYLKVADREGKSVTAEFPDGLDWFNVTEPLTLQGSLRGKVVVLDFFTYCCINCMHILPNLKRLEHMYPIEKGLVVVGVHSAKFRNEKDSKNIRAAVERYEISHPVVNDNVSAMWRKLRVQCWPTLMILGPRANPLFVIMGEGNFEDLKLYIGSTIRFYKEKGELRDDSLPMNLSNTAAMASNLKFPGKIACSLPTRGVREDNNDGEELYAVSDSGNHRILIIQPDGMVRYKIGGKQSGFVDGSFEQARFNAPQGVAFQGCGVVFVADNENHAIRKIDLDTQQVSTVVGNGVQGNDRTGGKSGRDQSISSPWDVAVYSTRDLDMSFHADDSKAPLKDVLLIAMAGIHQIWAVFLEETIWWKFKKYPAGTCWAIAGSGHEQNRNTSYPHSAAFAQPSGLAINRDVKEVYLADSESSAIRKISLVDGKVMAVAGGDRNPLDLFAFGDVDGKQYSAKFQHPLGVAYNPQDGCIYFADTYNHKIKKIDATTNCAVTCEFRDSQGSTKRFNEPAGLCLDRSGRHLYIADTNNHELLVADLSDNTVRPMELYFRVPEEMDSAEDRSLQSLKPSRVITMPASAAYSLDLNFEFHFHEPATKFSEGAPQRWSLQLPSTKWVCQEGTKGTIDPSPEQGLKLQVTLPKYDLPTNGNGESALLGVDFKLNLCEGDVCFPKEFTLRLDVNFSTDDAEVLDNYLATETIKIYLSRSKSAL
ncbi:NHL repeat-containing protein 2 [Anopheles ziemanni]|uniref:NHL repeat-containing protein 2 n=1 Tax=Anopheles coustani TaxID=139045 RepID=UPI00265A33D6|nr:NHL repeat-containing protein 2 [Anopheles coustani]XP_058171210.1 NHL repeat-containing protein 2 [Anopheles ziemanni]